MAVISKEFNTYRIQYYTGGYSAGLVAYIACKKNHISAGTMSFYAAGFSLPTNELSSNDSIRLAFYETSIPAVINLLQNEKPLYLNVNSRSAVGWLSTSDEFAGEEES